MACGKLNGMKTIAKTTSLRNALRGERSAGRRIALVPTMGNLHAGHMQLVRQARRTADVVVVSLFVNPLQFGPDEDLDCYPRTFASDRQLLFAAGVDYLFCPGVDDMYPNGLDSQTLVSVPELSSSLCGASRPGHFTGVATVVTKLFQLVQPDLAVFGQKDFQQLAITRRLGEDLCIPVEALRVEPVRDSDGIARWSRAGYVGSS